MRDRKLVFAGKDYVLQVQTATDRFKLTGYPQAMSAFSHVSDPLYRNLPSERTYFNNVTRRRPPYRPEYDQLFHVDYGFVQQLERCDWKDLLKYQHCVNCEEQAKPVPACMNSWYGHRKKNPDIFPDTSQHRVHKIRDDFYATNGMSTLKPDEELHKPM